MLLSEFRRLTAHRSGETEIHIIGSFQTCKPAAMICRRDLDPEDPAYDTCDPDAITLDIEAD